MGRSHDYYCPDCKAWWSPFDFDRCPGPHAEDRSVYDLNHDAETIDPYDGSGQIVTGECRVAMSGPTCFNPACPPCQTPELTPCPGCPECEPASTRATKGNRESEEQ